MTILGGLALVSIFAGQVLAAKPAGNTAGAVKVPWNLSGAVMPVPPYGSGDIIGSDTASKLIVNQPIGTTAVTITGAMNGLLPNTTYTVYPSSGWSTSSVWNVTGTFGINVVWEGNPYPETLILTQSGTSITGVSLDTVPAGSYFTVTGGSVIGNVINIYADNGSYFVHMIGTIAPDGKMSGDWHDEAPGTRIGTWASTSGAAVGHQIGSGHPGLYGSLHEFTFTTDEFGSGSWHINLTNADLVNPITNTLSIWINGGGATVLVSNNFDVVKN